MLSHFRLTDSGRRPPAHRYEDCDFIVFSSVAAACAGVAEPAATVVDATPMACCRLALTVESRGSELVDVLLMSCWRFDCWTEPLTSGTVDQSGCMPPRDGMSFRRFPTTCCPAVEVVSQVANVVAAAWWLDLLFTA